MSKKIILIGFMGAGKTTVGKCLAQKLECRFLDTDECIELSEGKKISEIFAAEGEAAFRDMETELLKKLQREELSFVLSVGGGMPVRKENRELLRCLGEVVYLKASKETILGRVAGDTCRPLLQGGGLEERVGLLMEEREGFYREAAHIVLETDRKTPEELAAFLADRR